MRVDGPDKQPLLVELIAIEMHYRRQNGEVIAFAEYQTRFPGLSALRLEATIQHSEQRNSPKTPAADDATIDSQQVSSERQEGKLVKYFGDYELLDVIARGGMGIVYKARQVSLDRIVALKMILSGEFASKEEVERFYSEAKAAALLDHPGIVPIYEVGENEGKHFFSMTYVEGSSLAAKLIEGPLEPMQAANTILEVSRAVHYAHEQGVIHRDLKPSNILLDLQGRPRVTDFGLAKRLSEDTGMTVSGQVLGTPSYMPPEQAAGHINTIGPASDVYALGAVLYSLTTGRPPFQSASSIDTLRQVVEKEPVAPRQLNSAIPRDLETIILKCLEKSLPRRYQTAKLLSEELQRFVEGRPIVARPIGRVAKVWRWCRRQPMVASLVAAVFLSLILGIGFSSYYAIQESRERREQERQTGIANEKTQVANTALQAEELARKQAQEAEQKEQLKSRELARTLYNSDLNRIEEFSRSGNIERIDALLRRQIPKDTSEADLRGMEWYYWWKYAHEEHSQWKLPASIERLSLSSDGKTLVAACEGGKAYLWDTTSQTRLPQVLDINEKHWSAIQFVADQPRVIGVGWQGRRREWSLGTEEITIDYSPISKMEDRERYVRWPAAISPDGQTMAGVVDEKILSGIAITSLPVDPNPPRWMIELSRGTLYTYSKDPESLMAKYRFLTPNKFGAVSASEDLARDFKWFTEANDPAAPPEEEWGTAAFGISFSSNGKLVAGGNRDGRIIVYNAETGQMLGQIHGHSALVWSVAFSPDAKMLATGDANGHVHVWDVATQKQICDFSGHNGAVRSLTFVSNNRVASAGDDTLIRILDVRSNDSTNVLRGHTARVNSLIVSVDGKRLFSGSADGTTRVWSVSSEMGTQSSTNVSVISNPGTRIHGLRLSSDASQIEVVSYSGSKTLRRRDWLLKTISGETMQALTFGLGTADFSKVGSSPLFGKYSPNGLAGIQSAFLDWEMLIQKYPEAAKPFKAYPSSVCGEQVFQCITHSEDFNYLVTSFYIARLYGNGFSIAWQNIRKDETDFFVPLGCVKLNASWTVLAPKGDWYAASVGNEVRIVDLAGNTNLLLGTHSKAVTRLAWGNEGKWVASSDEDGFVKVWDVFDRRPITTMRNHTGSVHAILFTNDSRTLFSAGRDEQILGCDPLSGEIKLRLNGHRGSVRDLCFHEGKQLLASGGDDGIVRLWHTADRGEVAASFNLQDDAIPNDDKVISKFRSQSELNADERSAAIKLLNKGCTLSILHNGKVKQFSKGKFSEKQLLENLPKDTFHVTGVVAGTKPIATRLDVRFPFSSGQEKITDADLELASCFPLLATVHIEGHALTSSVFNHLKDHPFLRQLIFRDTKISEVDLRIFEFATKLQQIDFGHAKIEPDSLTACRVMPMLRSLNLSGSDVQDRHLAALSGLADLRYLNLAQSPITSEGLEHLAALEQLKFLDLSKTKVGDAGVEALIKLEKLERLDLTETEITMDGALSLMAAQQGLFIKIPDNLETDRWEDRALFYGHNHDVSLPGRSGIGKLIDGKHLTQYQYVGATNQFTAMRGELFDEESFAFKGTRPLNEIDLQMFEHLVHVEELTFGSESLSPSSEQITRILKNKSLKKLTIGCKLDYAGMTTVTQQASLQSLSLSLVGLSDPQLVRLNELQKLTDLDLSKGEFDPASIRGACERLASLRLYSVALKGEGLKALASLPKLTRLDVKLKEHYSLEQIRDWFPNLRQLRIDDSRIVVSEVASIADHFGKLESLEIWSAKLTEESITDFGKMSGLKNLVLRKTGLGYDEGKKLARLLPKCKVEVKDY